jgi:hypothetical protein
MEEAEPVGMRDDGRKSLAFAVELVKHEAALSRGGSIGDDMVVRHHQSSAIMKPEPSLWGVWMRTTERAMSSATSR